MKMNTVEKKNFKNWGKKKWTQHLQMLSWYETVVKIFSDLHMWSSGELKKDKIIFKCHFKSPPLKMQVLHVSRAAKVKNAPPHSQWNMIAWRIRPLLWHYLSYDSILQTLEWCFFTSSSISASLFFLGWFFIFIFLSMCFFVWHFLGVSDQSAGVPYPTADTWIFN